MDHATAQSLAESYIAFFTAGDLSFRSRFSPDFYDHVNGQRGLETLDVVRGWIEETFGDRRAELHLVTHTDDTVMLWYTARARHIGSSHPSLRGVPVKGNEITWPQVHVFRLEGDPERVRRVNAAAERGEDSPVEALVVEHWAVRDDLAMLTSAKA